MVVKNYPEMFWQTNKQNVFCFRKKQILTKKTKGGGVMFPKKLVSAKILTAFQIQVLKACKKRILFKNSILSRKNLELWFWKIWFCEMA